MTFRGTPAELTNWSKSAHSSCLVYLYGFRCSSPVGLLHIVPIVLALLWLLGGSRSWSGPAPEHGFAPERVAASLADQSVGEDTM
jgi:hypothetical protein